MNNIQVLPIGEPVGVLARSEIGSFKAESLFDEDITMPEPIAEELTKARCRQESPKLADRVLRVMGVAELTAPNGRQFREQVRAALDGQTVIEIDLSQTTAMDCAGLGALVAIRNFTRKRNGVVRLVKPSSRVQQLLGLMRAAEIFEIVPASS